MSKLSDYHAELEEQATELGFESLQQAQDAGCEVEWHKNSAELVEPLVTAHRAWEKKKAEVLESLRNCLETSECSRACGIDIARAIKFIEEAHE